MASDPISLTDALPSPRGGDINDYSRFDNIGNDDTDDLSELAPAASAMSYNEAVNLANIMKEVGNTSFKASNTEEALTNYSEAVAALGKLSKDEQKKDEIVSLLTILHGNMSMCYVKLSDFSKAAASATLVLDSDSNNVKALYRRGCAFNKLKAFDDAKKDLTRVLVLDSSNVAAKKELLLAEKSLKEYGAKEREKFGGMFSRSKSMYDDKEKLRLHKLRLEEEKEAKLKDDWTQNKIAKRNRGEEELTFEAWREEKEKEEKEKKEAEKKEQKEFEDRQKRDSSSTVPKKAKPFKVAKHEESDDDDDEETKKLIKGYKTMSDGRKTSYFTNELDAQTKELIGDIAPKAISVSSVDASEAGPAALHNTSSAPKLIDPATSNSAGSAWNHAGTFEEKDMSAWAKERLTALLSEAKLGIEATGTGDSILTGAIHLKVTSVKKCDGDAEIIVSRGKTRFLFDFDIKLEWEAVLTAFPLAGGIGDEKDNKFKGTLNISDVSPDSELEHSFAYKKAIPPEYRDRVNAAAAAFLPAIKAQIKQFERDYQQTTENR